MKLRFFVKIFWVIIFTLLSESVEAQRFVKTEKPDPKFAKLCMHFGNYYDGLNEYERLLRDDPNNILYRYNSGICHLKLNKDKSRAIPFFLWVVSQDKFDNQAYYFLGEAYLVTGEYDKAIAAFQEFQNRVEKDDNRIPASRMIAICNNAKEAVLHPVSIEITNLGKHINSPYPEFNPYVPEDETILIFNAQKKTRYRDDDGYYPSDLYMTYFKYGRYRRIKRMSAAINSPDVEKAVGITPNGATVFVYTRKLLDKKSSLMMTQKRGRSYRSMVEVHIPGLEKSKKYAAALSPKGKHILIVVESRLGIGGKDIFMSNRLPDGNWGKAILLDSTVNTVYDDNYPYFAPDGKSFFFASEGHNSMGGYDLFRCEYNEDSSSFSKPENLGYPINTSMDDRTISLSTSMRYAYIASLREGGFGDLDLYRVVMKDVQPLFTVVSGRIFNQDSVPLVDLIHVNNERIDSLNQAIDVELKAMSDTEKQKLASENRLPIKIPNEKMDVQIRVIDLNDDKECGHFIVNENTGNYNVILPPGKFRIEFRRKGSQDYIMDHVIVKERDKRNRFVVKHVLLLKE